MKNLVILVVLSTILIVNGSPVKSPPLPDGTADKLDSFPWIKASKAKAKFGPTTTQVPPVKTDVTSNKDDGSAELQPILTNEMLQSYIASLTAQLQPYVIKDSPATATPSPYPPMNFMPPPLPPKKSWKAKVPKQINPQDVPESTEPYWAEEKKLYPDSFYDELYLDWLKKRQVEEIEVATPAPMPEVELEQSRPVPPPPSQPSPQSLYPAVPMTPYMASPFMYPLAGFKISKAMAQAQVNAALAALNITTTQKPVKIKLKIPIPAGDDLATVVASGISGFPAGTTYELSKK